MAEHPALAPDRVAVVTGAASGIGLAAAERFADLGMKVAIADADAAALEQAAAAVVRRARTRSHICSVVTDVSRRDQVERLAKRVNQLLGPVAALMNNAGREGDGELFAGPDRWHATLDTNLWGVIHGIQTFAPAMMKSGAPGAIITTGSKQGITTPPGDTAYNVSKAGVKVVTEALAHALRSAPDCQVTAHLLIPGFTFTGFTRKRVKEKPAGAWTPEQVIDFLLPALARGDFYILCPDNDVTRIMDEKRIRWAADDIVLNRPALSRWHPEHAEAFSAYMRDGDGS